MLYAEVAVEAARALDRESYTYSVPDGVDLVPGHRVLVPFGRRSSYGYVVRLHTEPPEMETKGIERADAEPLLLPHQMELGRAVATHYWAPLIEVLRAMLPPRVRGGRSSGAGPSARQWRHSRLLQEAALPAAAEPGPPLTGDQLAAVEVIREQPAVLLHGVTGSGKTEVYMAAAAAALAQGLRVLYLAPEISLTPQLVSRLRNRLGLRPAVLHSQLTELERAQEWWRVRRGEATLVLGSRSAVFAPVPRLGLVIVDEEGSAAYKQDRTPRYEAVWVARRLAALTGARLVLGSATPTVTRYHAAVSGELALARLPRRVRGRPPTIELVDMRDEEPRGAPLGRRLLEMVDQTLRNEEQVILFLNRRGLATFLLCRDCGRAVECPNCSVAMVHHPELNPTKSVDFAGTPSGSPVGSGGLACHYCGHTRPLPGLCPYCGSRQIRGLGMGTQRLESAVRRLWPEARVLRLDRDSARGPDAYFEIYEAFAQGRADILVGTQLVARGLDLEAVTAVGVIDADLPLHFPDYRSGENTFALVTQVAGRAGRSRRPARVVVQTFNPDHYSLRHAAAGDYEGFYREELPMRKAFSFPPFAELAVLTVSNPDDAAAAGAAREAAEALASGLVRDGIAGVRLLGPSPAFIHKLRGEYRWQLTLKGEDLERVRPLLPRGRAWSFDVDPFN